MRVTRWMIVSLILAVSLVTLVAQNTVRLVNTQYNAEGTGNVLTLPFTYGIQAGICEGGAAYQPMWHSAMTTLPGSACVAGSNVLTAQLDFEDGSSRLIYNQFRLPTDWTGTVSFTLYWKTSATTGNVIWNLSTACAANDETIDPSWNTAQAITDAALGSANRLNAATQSSVTTTGCAAGEILFFKIQRDGTAGGDTIAATASLVHVEWTYRRAI